MRNDDQMKYPGEERYYDQGQQTPNSQWQPTATPQNFVTGQGDKFRESQPRQQNVWRIAALFLLMTTVIFLATTVLAYNHIINPTPTSTVRQAAQQTLTSGSTLSSTPTSSSALSVTPTTQPSALVADGVITKNLTLTCQCDDPIRVTINTIQIDNANGRMIWDTSLKDITSNSLGYQISEDLQANTQQTQAHATFSQGSGTLVSNTPYDIQGIFAFVPSHNVMYTLTVVVYTNSLGLTMKFDPVTITF
ncbi:MAG: hypothetical protein JO202_05470 [Ktedonobacteraceae bacterium]|nr:hypothetical protein [Ktedonobacteraceae bacterium]